MNALAKTEDAPTMANVPIRPHHAPAIECRIVSTDWFDTNEAQIRHLFQVAQGATRENVTLKESVEKARTHVRTLVSWYRDATIVRDANGQIDFEASLSASFGKLVIDRRRKMVALSELVYLKKLKDVLGKTPEYEARQPKAWLAAIEAMKASGDNEEVIADHHYIRDLQMENVSLRAANRHLEQNERDNAAATAPLDARIRELEIQLSAARRERDRFEIVAEGKELKAKAFQEESDRLLEERDIARTEAARLLNEINTPETVQFLGGVTREAAHQRQKWGTEKDAAKTPEDWFWLLGYLAGKACRNFALADTLRAIAAELPTPECDPEREMISARADEAHAKGVHHLVTSAAALANWHLNARGIDTRMSAGRDFQKDDEPEGAGPHTIVSTIEAARSEADRIAGAAYAVERAAAHEGAVVDAEFPEVEEKPSESYAIGNVVVTP